MVSNPSGRKGTAWETEICKTLKMCGWPYAERRRLSGSEDRGDIAGIPGVVIEAKNCRKTELASWVDEANIERDNDHADLGVAWFKRRGKTSALDGFVAMDGRTFLQLIHAAGYGGNPGSEAS